jgi:hypothetical protein
LLLLLYRAVQQIRGVFYLDISFICWFRGHLGPHLFFLELCSPRSWWRTQRVRRYNNSWCTYFWKPFWKCPWDIFVSLIRLSSGKQQKLPVWGLLSSSARLSGFLNFHMLYCKNFVVDGNASRSCPLTGFGNGGWHLK